MRTKLLRVLIAASLAAILVGGFSWVGPENFGW
jgi:hypothetical protein